MRFEFGAQLIARVLVECANYPTQVIEHGRSRRAKYNSAYDAPHEQKIYRQGADKNEY